MVSIFRSHLRFSSLVMWLVAGAATLAAVLVWASFARTLSNATPVPVADIPQTNAVVWHHRVYQSRAALARDLERAGGSYTTWARNHPPAAELLASFERARLKAVAQVHSSR